MRRSICALMLAAGFLALQSAAIADTSVVWVAPPGGTVYPAGTIVTPTGQAGASGMIGGTGLDLALVIDTSGSMIGTGITAARNAAIALVNALPTATTSVAVIEFDSYASVWRQLSPLTTDRAAIIAAINALGASGGTVIGAGIDAAATELTSARHTAGHSQQMVVLSDGVSSGNPEASAVAAVALGIDAIHTVGVPGHSVATMRGIADGPDDIYGNSDDYGVYTSGALSELEGLFAGTAGNLVGIDYVEVTMPDGTTVTVPTDGLGNFSAPAGWSIVPGAQTWTATAYGTDGTSATAALTLVGESPQGVPDGGSALVLLGMSLVGLFGLTRRIKA